MHWKIQYAEDQWVQIVLLVLAAALAAGQPQQPQRRQSPLSMGLKMLENLRDNMTKTIQGFFGGGTQQAKTPPRPQPAPPQPHFNSPPPHQLDAPPHVSNQHQSHSGGNVQHQHSGGNVQHQHSGGNVQHQHLGGGFHQHSGGSVLPPVVESSGAHDTTPPPSSFFTVVHEVGAATPAPHSADSSFLPPPPPFQGAVDEDHFPRPPHAPAPLPLDNNHLPPPHDSFPPHSPSSTAFTSFGSRTPSEPDNAIPFGNTATFTLGTFRSEPAPHSLLNPEEGPAKRETQQRSAPRGSDHHSFRTEHQQHQHQHQQQQQPAITLLGASTESVAHPKITLLSHSPSPTHIPLTAQRRSPEPPQPTLRSPQGPQDGPETRKDSGEPQRTGSGHINTGIKMKVTPTQRQDGTTESEVSGYEFGYGVLDRPSGNQYFHAEKREEGQTKGSYKIQLPDGRIQTVTYVANNHGFHPKITYDGEAQYPSIASTTDTP